ncbi:ImmA/IrrE family metallo-endopeptidase (plasmid) [Deinococcus psychrotolerans]|uniref:ImmA/IrrE family metallo-endopeptidase n=1 Tax=Deinococcus psychrotolerans TaxID=2489213 RepID=A0A3G8YJ61_9DEIO|nr:ImmA/IrrE family metallo-endopeptidase [Deinococcus psychrotolerans]AZI45282.1 ImmA/IrrE family metallo-endopeptidase [Deinococcus psychrotolerans]
MIEQLKLDFSSREVSSRVNPLALFAKLNGATSPERAMKDLCRRARLYCHMHEPPFGLMNVTRMLKVEVERSKHLPAKIRGRLERRATGYVIVVNEYLSWRRLRSTVAHELGHVLLYRSLSRHPEAISALREPEQWAHVEALCDLAAAELLMPLDDLWGFAFPDILSVYNSELHMSLYDRYLVSYTALFKRHLDLGVDLVLLWRAIPSTMLTWRISSAYHKGNYFIPPGMSATKHLFPNILDGINLDESGWRITAPEMQFTFQGRVLEGECAIVDSTPRRAQPLFEGFRVADEPNLSLGAVMLMRFKS